MEIAAAKKLKRRVIFLYLVSFAVLLLLLFIPAGSLRYWQGWVSSAVALIPQFIASMYFLKKTPEFLELRAQFKEKETKQKTIIIISYFIFLAGILLAGFDYRFGWSVVPVWIVIIADCVILSGYYLVFLAFRENRYAARTVEVFAGQKVIDTGPYSIVRHPMYAGVIPIFLFLPLALGSFWAMIPFLLVVMIVILRILNEENILQHNLPGYLEYCEKVRYRLVPFIW